MNTSFSDLPNYATIQVPTGQRGEGIPCCFQGMESKRLNLTSRERLTASTAVTVEYNDAMFLGEVVACTHNCDDTWHIEVKVEQVLTGLQSLMNLRSRLLGETAPVEVGRARSGVMV